MGRGEVIADGIGALIRLFRGKPDFVTTRRVPGPVRPRPDPEPPPPPPPVPHRPPYIPRLRDPDAETQPEGQTESETTTTTEEMQECESCPECEPRKQGHAIFRTFTGTDASKLSGAQYQNWVIPWFRWVGNQIEEWMFQAVRFDGIDQTICQLIEAKGKYGFMFVDPADYTPEPYEWAEAGPLTADKREFDRQYSVVWLCQPQAMLHWVMHNWAYNRYMHDYISNFGPYATTEHRPYPEWDINE
jgi:hypothetical protein